MVATVWKPFVSKNKPKLGKLNRKLGKPLTGPLPERTGESHKHLLNRPSSQGGLNF